MKLKAGRVYAEVTITKEGNRLFLKFGYNRALINEIKRSFEKRQWHPERKVWSVENTARNQWVLQYLNKDAPNPYEKYRIQCITCSNTLNKCTCDKAILNIPKLDFQDRYNKQVGKAIPHWDHQKWLVRATMVTKKAVWGAEPRTGKTLADIEIMERSGFGDDFWFIGPKSALAGVRINFRDWGCKVHPRMLTYEELVTVISNWKDEKAPRGVIFDEVHYLKNGKSKRTQAAIHLVEGMIADWGDENIYVIGQTGTPSPRFPDDWWGICEAVQAGYILEPTPFAFRRRLANIEDCESAQGDWFPRLKNWWDNTDRCSKCGDLRDEHTELHTWKPSVNEIDALYKRLRGFVTIVFKKDCLDLPDRLPDKIVRLEPSPSMMRAYEMIEKTSEGVAAFITKSRELSDGFQYVNKEVGKTECPRCLGTKKHDEFFPTKELPAEHPDQEYIEKRGACSKCKGTGKIPIIERTVTSVDTPKDDALRDELAEVESVGRIVIYAGFTASIDRCVKIAIEEGWNVFRVDKGQIKAYGKYQLSGFDDLLLKFRDTQYEKIAYIGHPESGSEGFSLSASPVIVCYSNTFKADKKTQLRERIDDINMDMEKGSQMVELFHLPVDEFVYNNLMWKKNLEQMSMGAAREQLGVIKCQS